ncbi:MAG: hypothetical protein RMK29_00420 [Myxococcales bacterium]|nr:hypothetical protein [Myxococcota bacterium]MDW8280140.1 hypothetical protein [Myxococcales bacterium]
MSANDHLRDLVSHRVTFEYENGATVTGYVAACRPAQGPVLVMSLTRAEVANERGQVIEHHRELVVVPSVLVGYHLTEGPSASPTL